MKRLELKSSEFRRERQATWTELEHLIDRVDAQGLASLSPEQVSRLPLLYRATLSSLSVAKAISLDRNLLVYLEALSTRAYLCLYGSRASLFEALGHFFLTSLPAAVRDARWYLFISIAILLSGMVTGLWLTLVEPDYFYTFVPESLVQGRSPVSSNEALREPLYRGVSASEEVTLFASFLFTHNAEIGILCFTLGLALGLPTLVLLFTNGLTLGAFIALYVSRDMGIELSAWLFVHGTTELLAVALCGAGGLLLGSSLLFPGRHDRLATLARQGRKAAVIAIGAVVLFFIAALLEGIARQAISEPSLRFLIGGLCLAAWAAYFALVGRGKDVPRNG